MPGTPNDSSNSEEREYTLDQMALVLHIRNYRNYYHMMSIRRTATVTEINRAYKKLALKLHPDKNRAPGAIEAFKLLRRAVDVLTDENKRREYDEIIHAQMRVWNRQRLRHRPRYRCHNIHATSKVNLDVDDIIPKEEKYLPFNVVFYFALAALVIYLIIYWYPGYSFVQTSEYTILRKTKNLLVPYYVQETFEKDLEGPLERFENAVEQNFIYKTQEMCSRERRHRTVMMSKACTRVDDEKCLKARLLETPSCEKLKKLFSALYNDETEDSVLL